MALDDLTALLLGSVAVVVLVTVVCTRWRSGGGGGDYPDCCNDH